MVGRSEPASSQANSSFLPPHGHLARGWVANAGDPAEQRPAVSSTPRVVWGTIDFWDSGLLVGEDTGLRMAEFWAVDPVTQAIASARLAIIRPCCISAVTKRCQDHTTIYWPFLTAQLLQGHSAAWLSPASCLSLGILLVPWPRKPPYQLHKAVPGLASSSTSLESLRGRDPLYSVDSPSCVQQPFSHHTVSSSSPSCSFKAIKARSAPGCTSWMYHV